MQTDLVIQLGCAPHGVRQALGEVGHLSSVPCSALARSAQLTLKCLHLHEGPQVNLTTFITRLHSLTICNHRTFNE